jgi:hypothetical protein
LVEGIAGVGKTHFLQALVAELRALGKSVAILSKTHVASQRAGGCTADHWVRRHVLHGSPSAQVIWVDECYQIDTSLLAQFNKIATRQWLLSGDPHQFPPVFDGWRGAPVAEAAFRDSNLLKTMSGCHRLTLTTCHRSDRELFDWYSSLILGGSRFPRPLAEVLAEARLRFRLPCPARHNLCISHRRRVQLNKAGNERERRAHKAVLIKAGQNSKVAGQNMWLWPGIELLGSAGSRRIRNGVLYTVTAVDHDSVTLGDIQLSHAQAAASLRLSYARTYASIQGTEFDGTVALWDTEARHFTMRHLFVALSRAKNLADLHVN